MKEHINLFQPDLLNDENTGGRSLQRWTLPIIFLLGVLVFVGFYVQDGKKRALLKKEVESMMTQRDQLRQQIAALANGSPSDREKSMISSLGLESVLSERVLWSRVLQEVSLVVPEGAWMTQFEIGAAQEVHFEGFAVSVQKVTGLIGALESSTVFQDISLDFSRQGEGKVFFSIHAHLRKEGVSL